MIERSQDLTFVWGFFRSFCCGPMDLILIRLRVMVEAKGQTDVQICHWNNALQPR